MKKDPQFRSKRAVPVVLLIAAAAVGFYLSLPISGFGGKEDLSVASPPGGGQSRTISSDDSVQNLKNELDAERQQTVKLEKELLDEKIVSQDRLRVVTRYKGLVGMTDVAGEGIIIILSEKGSMGGFEQNPGKLLIHQEDLLNIINELWYHGAEAISIGSPGGGKMERITTFSPARCRGGTIEINKTMMYPPFEIRAIGDSGLLKSVMEMPDSILKKLEYNNIESKVETSEYVFIPKYNGAAIWLYGRSLLGAVEDEDAGEAEAEG